jgi:monoamine oxidase
LGRVHWAGTETSTRSHGAIDGAVLSGQRAAGEILDRT